MKLFATLLGLLGLASSVTLADTTQAHNEIYASIGDLSNNYQIVLYEAPPVPGQDSDFALFAVFKGDPKVLVGTYATLGEALGQVDNPDSLYQLKMAWGQSFLSKFHSLAEAEAGIAVLEKSTGPNDLGLSLIRAALPTMEWAHP